MAEITQNINGKWKIVDIKHDNGAPSDVTFPATFTYKNRPVHLNITTSPQTVETNWVTGLGVKIGLSEIDRKYKNVTRKEGGTWKTYEAYDEFSDDTDVVPFIEVLDVSCTNTSPGQAQGNATLSITSNTIWTITVVYDGQDIGWIHVPLTAGTGNTAQTVTFDENTGTTQRSGTVVVSSGRIEKRITIRQAAFVPTISIVAPSEIPATATSISYSIITNVPMFVVRFESVEKTTSTGSFSIPENQSTRPLTHTINAQCSDYPAYTATTSVTQVGVDIVVTSITLDNLTWSIDIPATGGTATKDNCAYTVRARYNDGTVEDITDHATVTGSHSVPASSNASRHTAGTLTLTATYANFTSNNASVTIYQAAAEPYLRVNCSNTSPGSQQSTATLTIESNISWTISSDVDWITVASPAGTGNDTRQVDISKNQSQSTRIGKITVVGGNITGEITITQAGASEPLTISPESFTCGCHGHGSSEEGSKLTITNNPGYSWAIQVNYLGSETGWLSLNKLTGNASDTVTIRCARNFTTNQRKANIIVSYEGNDLTCVYTQLKADFSITISGIDSPISKNGATLGMMIVNTIGHNWELVSKPDWVTNVSPSAETRGASAADRSSGNITAATNTGEARSGVIVFREHTSETTTINHSFNISQEGGPTTQPVISITSVNYVLPASPSQTTVTMVVTNGEYDRYGITSDTQGINPTVTNVSVSQDNTTAVLTISFPDIGSNQTVKYTITGYGRGTGASASLTCQDSIEIKQVKSDWFLPDADYILFTYEWDTQDGKDLDSYTFIYGAPSSYSEIYDKGVGYGNGTKYEHSSILDYEKFIGSDYSHAILKLACDNTKTGGEFVLINLKELKSYLSSWNPPSDAKLIIYLMGNWFAEKGTRHSANIKLSAYTGTELIRELVPNTTDIYRYSPTTGTEYVSSVGVTGIDVFAAHGTDKVYRNESHAAYAYTTMAAFEINLKDGSASLYSGENTIKNLTPGIDNYQHGVVVNVGGNVAIPNKNITSRFALLGNTLEIPNVNTAVSRTYGVELETPKLLVRTGSTPSTEYRMAINMKPDTIATETGSDADGVTLSNKTTTGFTFATDSPRALRSDCDVYYNITLTPEVWDNVLNPISDAVLEKRGRITIKELGESGII